MPEPNYTEANLDYERSILRVSPEELPAIFHYPMGNSHIGSTLDDPTLASRFANWTGIGWTCTAKSEIKRKKTQSVYTVYQEGVWLCGCVCFRVVSLSTALHDPNTRMATFMESAVWC